MMLLKQRLIVGLLTCAMLPCFLNGCGGNAANTNQQPTNSTKNETEDTYKLTVAVGFNEDQPAAFGLKKFKEDVEAKSDGKISVELFFNGIMGGDTEITDAVIQGNITMGVPGVSPMGSYVKELTAIDTPFLFSSVEQARATLDSDVGQEMLDAMSKVGLKGLAFWENGGFRNLTCNKEVHTVSDLKGLKIRVVQSDLHVALWTALGANPAPLSYSELYTALQQKAFDCQENSLSNIQSSKFYEVQKYIINTKHVYAALACFINEDFWNSLPAEYQELIQTSVKECNEYSRKLTSEQEIKIHEFLEDYGTVFIDLSEDELETFRACMDEVYEDIAKTTGEDFFERFCNTARELEKNGI